MAQRKTSPAADPAPTPRIPPQSRGPLAAAALLVGVVLVAALSGRALWESVAPLVVRSERYMLLDDRVSMTALPEWVANDIRGQILQGAGFDGRLSLLDSQFVAKVEAAFALHPWIDRVTRVEKRLPRGVHVEVEFRCPVAVVETPHGEGSLLLPVDATGILLPADDVPLIRRSYLPRISAVAGRPPVGQRWDDPRLAGALSLAVRLTPDWESLSLMAIYPAPRPREVRGQQRYFAYDLMTRGGTRIVWGAAPDDPAAGEDTFAEKLARLKQCVAQYAALQWTEWPESVDVRHGTIVTPRTAKKLPGESSADDPIIADKPPAADDAPVVK